MLKPLILAIGICSAVAYGNTTWQPDRNKSTSDSSNGSIALTDMSYWTNGLGHAGSGAPTSSDDLVFDKAKWARLRFNANTTGAFGFNSLQIGTAWQSTVVVHDGGDIHFANPENGGLKFSYGSWYMNFNGSVSFNCDVAILSNDAEKPFVMHVGQGQYSNSTLNITGKLKGSADACLVLGPWPRKYGDSTTLFCARNSTFNLNDISEYAGTIVVTSMYDHVTAADENHGYGTRLRLNTGSTTSSAKIHLSRGGSLSLKAFGDTVTVKELSLAAGSRLWFNHAPLVSDGKLWCVRATDALSVEQGAGDDKVEIYWKPGVCAVEDENSRIPILAGPAASTFATNDFKLTVASTSTLFNRDLHLEVDNDPNTGDRTLYVVADAAHAVVTQIANYSGEGDRDGQSGASSSLTNAAAWSSGRAPDAENETALYSTSHSLRTLFAQCERYTFPCRAFYLDGGTLIIQTYSFEVPELWCNGGTIGIGQGHPSGYRDVSLVAPRMHFLGRQVTLRCYSWQTLVLKGEIDGPANMYMLGWGATGSPKCNYQLDGINTNFTGRITVATDEVRPAYHDFPNQFPTLFIQDGRSLGGRMSIFDPRALTLATLARLSITNNTRVTLTDGLNRGVYIKHTGRFHVTGNGTLDVRWPLLLSGKMWKEGDGTLVLGGEMKHENGDGGNLTDIPRAGSNLFEIVAGTVKIAHADALAGVETMINAGATLQLALDPENADLTAYGIRNTAVEMPFTLDASFGGKLPLTLDTAGVEIPTGCRVLTNALATVKNTSAETVRAQLAGVRPWRARGFKSEIVSRANADTDTTTLLLVSRTIGTILCVR